MAIHSRISKEKGDKQKYHVIVKLKLEDKLLGSWESQCSYQNLKDKLCEPIFVQPPL